VKRQVVIARCVYCGARVRKPAGPHPATCRGHSDLPALDPLYNEEALDEQAGARTASYRTG
jgi:hypothetical protein